MKQRYLGWAVLCLSIFLTGCGISGFWMEGVGGKEREEYLKSIKPYLQYWEKPGMTVEGRREDSVSCGAGNTDHVGFNNSIRLKAAQRPGETERATETRLRQDWAECMKAKGYRYAK